MIESCGKRHWKLGLLTYLAINKALAPCSRTLAQIVPDTTLRAESSVITPNKLIDKGITFTQIDNGATRGKNLFHSFNQFSIHNENEGAYFNNASGIQNIIIRVTGGYASNINGLIRANSTVNLFLINPNGIVFGPNASLSIGGSFLASTASSLNFANGTQFSATSTQNPPLLTVDEPTGLQFGANPGSITLQSQASLYGATNSLGQRFPAGLQVQTGQTLALVGGDLTLKDGNLTAREGRIELGSVGSNSLVSLKPMEKGWTLNYQGVKNFQNIQLIGSPEIQPYIDVSGEGKPDSNMGSGGAIQLQGRQVTISGVILLSTTGSQPGGNLMVTASDFVKLIGESTKLNVYTYGPGDAGNITIDTGMLLVQGGAQVSTSTFGKGAGGQLIVNARDSVKVDGAGSPIQLPMGDTGFKESGLLSDTLNTGKAGDITINTERLFVQNGAAISAQSSGLLDPSSGIITPASGQGGNVRVNASKFVQLSGTLPNGKSGGGLLTSTMGGGAAGSITINTGQLNVSNGAVDVGSEGKGAAGNLEVTAPSIHLDNKGVLSAETKAEQGNINLNSQDLLLRRSSQISTNASTATGGNITIKTGTLTVLEDSKISANSGESFGGRVMINTQGLFRSPEAEIIAKSDRGRQYNGTVQINTLINNPSQGLVKLSVKPVDVVGQIAQGCGTGNRTTPGRFVVTGRGGLPPNPGDTLSSDAILDDTRLPTTTVRKKRSATVATTQTSNSNTVPIVPATGVMFNGNDEVTLIAAAPIEIPWLSPTACRAYAS